MVRQAKQMRVAVLASGTGSNFAAIVHAQQSKALNVDLALLVCNRPKAKAIDIASKAGIATALIDHRDFDSRERFDQAIVDALLNARIELVVMAGFDRLVTRVLVDAFQDRILNIHPALLPSFKGTQGQKQAVDYGVRIAGATVHFVDEHVDHGPIIAQAAIAIDPFDSPQRTADLILEQEHRLYSHAIQLFAEGRLRIEGRKVRILDARRPAEAIHNPPLS